MFQSRALFTLITVGCLAIPTAGKLYPKDEILKSTEQKSNTLPGPGKPDQASAVINKIQGIYQKHFKNWTASGESYDSTDTLIISRKNKDSISVEADLAFANGHSCFLEGEATYTEDGAFLYKGGGEECGMNIRVTKEGIKFEDGVYGLADCRDTRCGVRGLLDETEFYKSEKLSTEAQAQYKKNNPSR